MERVGGSDAIDRLLSSLFLPCALTWCGCKSYAELVWLSRPFAIWSYHHHIHPVVAAGDDSLASLLASAHCLRHAWSNHVGAWLSNCGAAIALPQKNPSDRVEIWKCYRGQFFAIFDANMLLVVDLLSRWECRESRKVRWVCSCVREYRELRG